MRAMLKVPFKNAEFLVDPTTIDIELKEREMLDRFWNVKEKDIVFDIGASVGLYSLAAHAVGAGFVYAFEPDKQKIKDFRANINYNKAHEKIASVPMGLWSSETQVYYDMKTASMMGANEVDSQLVPVTTIDRFVNERSAMISHIDYMKIDVEGAEMEVLKGATNTLMKYKPVLFLEMHHKIVPDILSDVRKFFDDLALHVDIKEMYLSPTGDTSNVMYTIH